MSANVAVVTGACGGLGRSIVRQFTTAGWTVVGGDVITDGGTEVEGIEVTHLDVTSSASWGDLARRVESEHGHVDVLVNNAAVLGPGTFEVTDEDDLRGVLDVNVVGYFLGIKTFMGSLATRRGSVILVGSVAGVDSDPPVQRPGLVSYVVSKWAVRGLARAAHAELDPLGVRVYTVLPSGMNTPMVHQLLGADGNASGIPGPDRVAAAVRMIADGSVPGLVPGAEVYPEALTGMSTV